MTNYSGKTGASLAGSLDFLTIFYILLAIILAIFVLLIFYSLYNWARHEKYRIARSLDMVLLQILLPKQSLRKEEEGKKEPKDLAARASQLFSALYAIKNSRLNQMWYKKGNAISFEIAAYDETIKFFIGVPQGLKTIVEKQVQAIYPDAFLEEVDRYNIFNDNKEYDAKELMFKEPTTLPIKIYKEFETDSVNSLTNVLSKLTKGEGAAIQFLIRPANNRWQKSSQYHAKSLQEGKGMKTGFAWGKVLETGVKVGGEFASAAFKAPEEAKKEEKPKTTSPIDEQKMKLIVDKSAFVGFETVVRAVVSSHYKASAKTHMSEILSAFSIFSHPNGNSFTVKKRDENAVATDFIFRAFPYDNSKTILNSEELASVFHFPNHFVDTPAIVWLLAKRAPVSPEVPKQGLYLGANIYRGVRTPIYMTPQDRVRHTYIVGKTGTGKSTMLKEMILQDIKNGEGLCYIDPHGHDVDDLLARIPKERAQDVILFNPADFERPMGINLLEYTRPEEKTLVVGELLNVFDKLYDLRSTGGPMFEQYFRNAALLVMEDPSTGSTLMEIPKVLTDEDFRLMKLARCQNPIIKNYWLKEAEKAGGDTTLANIVPYITSKLTQFLANDIMRPMIAQQESAFNIRELMDNKKIILMRLAKGQIGELNAYLLGLIMVSKIYLAAMSRADMPENQRAPFYLYIDEFQNFTTDSVASILSEARKYKLGLTIGHQYIGQLVVKNDTKIKDAVFGNVGTFVIFRVGEEDAEFLAKKFEPIFNAHDISNIENNNAYVSLLANGTSMKPFSMNVWLDFAKLERNPKVAEAITFLSRQKYGRDREEIEREIRRKA